MLASRFEISKQTLHRRQAERGEVLYGDAQDYTSIIEGDLVGDIDHLVTWTGGDASPEEFVEATRSMASQLLAVRRDPRWWEPGSA